MVMQRDRSIQARALAMLLPGATLLFCLVGSAVHADEALWQTLRQGGKVVLVRHAPVERGAEAGDPRTRDPSCRGERNLSAQGRRDAAELGVRFAEHQVPVTEVRHSPFCRTTDTAQIAFGGGSPAEDLSLLEILASEQAAMQTERLSRLIDDYSGAGNLVLVTHEPNINAISFEMMRHLDVLVIDPAGTEPFDELGVIHFTPSP
jgi:phosphohistidine phosphatase SixA